jgi:hypothetical protein
VEELIPGDGATGNAARHVHVPDDFREKRGER